ncbi:fungal-specific transcription factor-like protein [Stemphylium lycopersici]|uniref:Fungal-specific transcription factor-like protein n=1 Tax=Stemphylium lycopersici TaxID=183478 RepID=A0A364NE53_STELY|nr:fungal-specific transcription factor-like protein [Stemphylium lycopersici]
MLDIKRNLKAHNGDPGNTCFCPKTKTGMYKLSTAEEEVRRRAENPIMPPPSFDYVGSSHRESLLLEAGNYDFDFAQSGSLEFMQSPGMNFDLADCSPWSQPNRLLGYPAPKVTNIQPDSTVNFESLVGFQLPSHDIIIQLAELFFEHLAQMFPCFHKNSFLMAVADGTVGNHAPILLYAICCVSSRYHADDAVKKRSRDWYDQARILYELTRRLPEPGLRTIQAVPLLVFYAWTVGDYCASWLFLGKAWRQAVVLGLNRMDIGQDSAETPVALESSAGNDAPAPLSRMFYLGELRS